SFKNVNCYETYEPFDRIAEESLKIESSVVAPDSKTFIGATLLILSNPIQSLLVGIPSEDDKPSEDDILLEVQYATNGFAMLTQLW
ncbi:hypothetical protein BLOT_000093, partial [Blomia tropicalis]